MLYGLDNETIQSIREIFLKHQFVEKVVIYGSRAMCTFHNGSDIDLALFGEELTLSEQFSIDSDLDDLLLPYKFDISIYHKIENPDLINHINRVGKIFYEKRTTDFELP